MNSKLSNHQKKFQNCCIPWKPPTSWFTSIISHSYWAWLLNQFFCCQFCAAAALCLCCIVWCNIALHFSYFPVAECLVTKIRENLFLYLHHYSLSSNFLSNIWCLWLDFRAVHSKFQRGGDSQQNQFYLVLKEEQKHLIWDTFGLVIRQIQLIWFYL